MFDTFKQIVSPLAALVAFVAAPVVAGGGPGLSGGISRSPATNNVSRFASVAVTRPILMRLPQVAVETELRRSFAASQGSEEADGTWREDGQYIVIDVNGQKLRLIKSDSRYVGPVSPNQSKSNNGEIRGRLSHQKRPLVNCEVALIPLSKTWNKYTARNSRDIAFVKTDAQGIYRFVDVPPGPYKLKWRPAGQDGWIRRIELRPDVNVRANALTQAKEICVSLRTIN